MFAELVRDHIPDDTDGSKALFDASANSAAWPSAAAVWAAGGLDSGESASDPMSGTAATARSIAAGAPPSHGTPAGRLQAQHGFGDVASGAAAKTPAAAHGGASSAHSSVDVGSLGYSELLDRITGLVELRNRVEGEYLEALGEMTSRFGTQCAAYELRDKTRMNGPQARAESRLAHDLVEHGFGDTVAAMRRGEIHMSHAKVIARHSPKPHRRSEESFLGLCRGYPSDTVSRHTLAYESNQVFADLAAEAAAENLDPVDAELALQRHQRRVSLRCGDDGMWDLRGRLDFMTGRRLNLALQAAIRSLRHRHSTQNAPTQPAASAGRPGHRAANRSNAGSDNGAGGHKDETRSDGSAEAAPTTAQFAADALAQLMLDGPASQRPGTNLLIIADYDIVNDRLANPRLDDGTPISAQILADHATDTNVLPAVFKADWSELALGRTRNASDAQRLILAARDGGCIGCELTSEHTEAHHIEHHEHGGLTDIPNLASLCRPCHTSIHQHHRRIHTPPDGKPRLQPPKPTGNDLPPPEPASTSRPLPPEPTDNGPPALDDRVPAPARGP